MKAAAGTASHQAATDPRTNAAQAIQAAMRNKTSRAFPTWICCRCRRAAQARRAARRWTYSGRGSLCVVGTFQVIVNGGSLFEALSPGLGCQLFKFFQVVGAEFTLPTLVLVVLERIEYSPSQHRPDRVNRLMPVQAFAHQSLENGLGGVLIPKRHLILDDYVDYGVDFAVRKSNPPSPMVLFHGIQPQVLIECEPGVRIDVLEGVVNHRSLLADIVRFSITGA